MHDWVLRLGFILLVCTLHVDCRAPTKTAVPETIAKRPDAPLLTPRNYQEGEVFRYRLRRTVRDNDEPAKQAIGISEHTVIKEGDIFLERITWVEFFQELKDRSDLARKVAPTTISLDPRVPPSLVKPEGVPEMMGMVTDLFTFYVSVSRAAGVDRLRAEGDTWTNPETIRGDWSDGKVVLVGEDCLRLTLALRSATDDRIVVEASYQPTAEACMDLEPVFGEDAGAGEVPYNFKMIRRLDGEQRVVVWGHERFTVTTELSRKSGRILTARMDNELQWKLKMCIDEKLERCTALPPMKKVRELTLTPLHVRPKSKAAMAGKLPSSSEVTKKWTDRTGYHLGAVRELRRMEAKYLASPMKDIYLQELGTLESFLGNYANARRLFERLRPPPEVVDDPGAVFDGYRALPAIETILREAESRRAVFINEAHHVPMHRAFTLRLLQGLYERGYRYFAAETLSEDGEKLMRRGYPLADKTGYYTREPVYGDLIRTAIRLGYRPVGYEHFTYCQPSEDDPMGCQNQRERGQAENLERRILDDDPDAKIVVHAGYGHIGEKSQGDWIPMGAAFRDLTGRDPLTIEQVGMEESGVPEYEGPAYRAALERFRIDMPTVLRREDGTYFTRPPHYVDMQVFHPQSGSIQGRPDWLLIAGVRRPVPVPDGICREVRPCLVQAFHAGEPDEAVPIDQLEISGELKARALMLPAAPVRVRGLDLMGKVLNEARLESSQGDL